jgi:hypothetical protein
MKRPDSSFGHQLMSLIPTDGFSMRRTAERAGVHQNSLSRFLGNQWNGKVQNGLDSKTLERLWSYLDLVPVRCALAAEVVWVADSVGFAQQLRETIRSSGYRPVEIATRCGIPEACLSLFLAGKRDGLSFRSIERLWDLLDLWIMTRCDAKVALLRGGTLLDPFGALSEEKDDDGPFRDWIDDGEPFCY